MEYDEGIFDAAVSVNVNDVLLANTVESAAPIWPRRSPARSMSPMAATPRRVAP